MAVGVDLDPVAVESAKENVHIIMWITLKY
jgi:ribosomal protein L11 methylase PrmA